MTSVPKLKPTKFIIEFPKIFYSPNRKPKYYPTIYASLRAISKGLFINVSRLNSRAGRADLVMVFKTNPDIFDAKKEYVSFSSEHFQCKA